MDKRRVVITGMGIVSPVGNSIQSCWENIKNGRSGIETITHFDVSKFSVQFAGTIKDFVVEDYINKKDIKKMDPFIHYGIAAATQAFNDCGLVVDVQNQHRIGVSIGSGIGGIGGIEKGYDSYLKGGPRKISPFFVPSNIINMISGHVSILNGFKGPNVATVTACSTGTHNIGGACRMIVYGDADVMIAGGAERCSTPTGLGGFAAAKALSTRNDDPQAASRPWDKDRDGFVLGDGAGVLVLEEYGHAKRRNAKIYAEIIGFGMSGDAHHMTKPCPDGEGAAHCVKNALRDAKINPQQVDYVNAHGTSTPLGDKVESDAIQLAFNEHAKTLAISSTKSMTGHLLGAAGGIEAIFSALSIYHQVAPPTINLDNQDPQCNLDFIPGQARDMKIDVALSNSFGFGGTNASLVFQKL